MAHVTEGDDHHRGKCSICTVWLMTKNDVSINELIVQIMHTLYTY